MTGQTAPAGFALSPQQRRLLAVGVRADERVTCTIAVTGALDEPRLRAACDLVVQRYEILRTSFEEWPGLGEPLQVIGRSPTLELSSEPAPMRSDECGRPASLVTLSVPALAADPPSLALIVAELAAAYGGDPLDDEVMQYADVAAWCNELVDPTNRPPSLDNPSRLPLQGARTAAGRDRRSVTTAARPPADLLALWVALLHRHTGESPVVFATSVDGRDHEELRRVVGPLDRVAVLRVDAQGGHSLADLAGRLAALVETSRSAASFVDVAQLPVMPSGIDVVVAPPPISAGDVRFDVVEIRHDVALADVHCRCVVFPTHVDVEISAATGSYDGAALGWLADGFASAASMAERREVDTIDDLDILAAGERPRVFAVSPRMSAVPGGLAEVAGRMTIDAWDEHVTADELDRRSAVLAARLREQGVGAEVVVAVRADRRAGTVVALAAVWKAGGVALPIDPALPPGLVQRTIEAAGAAVTVTSDGHLVAHRPLASLAATAGAHDMRHAAYVIATSGTTGAPRLVVVEEGDALEYGAGIAHRLGLGRAPTWAALTSFATDLGHTALLGAMVTGGTLQIPPPDPAALGPWWVGRRPDCLKITPSYLAALLASPDPAGLLPTRVLVLGGEICSPDLVRRVAALAPDLAVMNHYGPTEATVGALAGFLTVLPTTTPTPVGLPLPGRSAVVLDDRGRPVPHGVRGRLHLGGRGLARGYLGDPAATAATFQPDPFADESGARRLDTGDLARQLPDGTFVIVGRADEQVKVRGLRVEPAGVADAIRGAAGVIDAAIVGVPDASGGHRLVAYVQGGDIATLGDHLRALLPPAAIPSMFVQVSALPRTAGGKLDRTALPDPTPARSSPSPRTALERRVAAVWCELLGISEVGIDDDFYALGGHSLVALRLLFRVNQAEGVDVPLAALLDVPTVAGVAAAVEAARTGDRAEPITALRREGAVSTFPASPGQRSMWFVHRMAPDDPAYNSAVVLHLSGALDPAALRRAVDGLVARHEALRTTFTELDGDVVQHVGREANAEWRELDAADGVTDDELAQEASRPFDLERGPLLRATLVRRAADLHLLALTAHHIAVDRWSREIIVADLCALYRGEALPPLAVQFADVTEWQRTRMTDEMVASRLAYWRHALEGIPERLALPTDDTGALPAHVAGTRVDFNVPPALTAGLRALARGERTSLFATLLAAVGVVLGRAARQPRLVIGTPFANRGHADQTGVVGFFVNTLPIALDLGGGAPFAVMVRRAGNAVAGALAHQDLPFERLVAELRRARQRDTHPVFQVVFAFQDAPDPQWSLPGVDVQAWEPDNGTAKFDLTLSLTDMGDSMSGWVEYRADRFAPATAKGWMDELLALLADVVADPEGVVVVEPTRDTDDEREEFRWPSS